jgi:hypothetical protein
VQRAGAWFLHSGIQEPTGGVARYHYIAEAKNAKVSTEITGYAVSALLDLFARCGNQEYLNSAIRAGDFLTRAYDSGAQAMPFEWDASGGPQYSYFFDNGIIVRGLLRLYRVTGRESYLATALACGESMARDFVNSDDIHPILELPSKKPVARDARWSRSSDCYQLKSALAWVELAEVTGDHSFSGLYEQALERALVTHSSFLSGEPAQERVMDRLHAYGYFLEALLQSVAKPGVAAALKAGLEDAGRELRRVRTLFERSDVSAQILRARLWADALGAVRLDRQAAEEEAVWAASHQISGGGARLDGGFNFGRRSGAASDFANPVSTAFCLQALAMWEDLRRGAYLPSARDVI